MFMYKSRRDISYLSRADFKRDELAINYDDPRGNKLLLDQLSYNDMLVITKKGYSSAIVKTYIGKSEYCYALSNDTKNMGIYKFYGSVMDIHRLLFGRRIYNTIRE